MTITIQRNKAVAKKMGISVSTLHDMCNPRSPRYRADFPKKVKIGAKSVGFIEEEIDTWLRSQQEQ